MFLTSEILNKAEECIKDIYAHDYFVSIWEQVRHQKDIVDCTMDELLGPFQRFWEALPDSSGIRRFPFFKICDLAEQYMYGDDDDDEDEL